MSLPLAALFRRPFAVSALAVLGCAQILGFEDDLPAAPCVLNSDCPPSQLCIFRVCSQACHADKDCVEGARCLDVGDSAACVDSARATCGDGSDVCPPGTSCDTRGVCRNACDSCRADQVCSDGFCVGTDSEHDPAAAGGAQGGSGGRGGSGSGGGAAATGGTAGDAGAQASESGAAGMETGAGGTSTGARGGSGGKGGAAQGGSGGKGGSSGGKGGSGLGGSGGASNAGAGGSGPAGCGGETAIGETVACSELEDGTPVEFPGGMAQGPCSAGTKECLGDDEFSPCTGVIVPGQADCTSANDNDCDGAADDTECGACVVDDIRFCYEGPDGTLGKGPCARGTQVCQLDQSETSTVWGECVGDVLPAVRDTCDEGNDATCNGTPNEGCACLNGTVDTCGNQLMAKGNCAAGMTTCSGGHWGPCSIVPRSNDTCDDGDDSTCDGSPNAGCGCLNGHTRSCGDSGTSCTLGTESCVNGSYNGVCSGNVCTDFDVTPPSSTCSMTGASSEDLEKYCTAGVCNSGYYVTSCDLVLTSGVGYCYFDGADSGDPTVADVHALKPTGSIKTVCAFSACTCRRNGH